MRWLCEDGHLCRPGEAVAFCNIGLTPTGEPRQIDMPFAEEWPDLQVAMAPRIAGRIRRSEASSRGGFLDRLDLFQFWTPDFVIGHMERVEGSNAGLPGPEDEVELLMATGRRRAELAEGRQGFLSGWHDRARAWRTRDETPPGTVLSLGICEQGGILRGESSSFFELFEAIGGPAQAVFVPDVPIVPSARVLVEQLGRSEAETAAIGEDLLAHLAKASPRPLPAEWIFAGAFLGAIRYAPLKERYDILSRTGLHQTGPSDAVVLSLNSEFLHALRHKRLGFVLTIHEFRLWRAGPTVLSWIRENFEPLKRSLDDIAADFRALIAAMKAAPGEFPAHVLVLNMMSSSGEDDVQNFAAFDEPLGETLYSVRAKDMNLMLHDLAHDHDVAIVDVDAVAADMGAQRNLPDGVHASGALQTELRGELIHILRARGVPGFGPAGVCAS